MSQHKSSEDRSGTIIGGVILIGLGTLFFLINTGVLPNWGRSWPGILIIVGVALLIGSLFRKQKRTNDGQI